MTTPFIKQGSCGSYNIGDLLYFAKCLLYFSYILHLLYSLLYLLYFHNQNLLYLLFSLKAGKLGNKISENANFSPKNFGRPRPAISLNYKAYICKDLRSSVSSFRSTVNYFMEELLKKIGS